MKKIIMLIVTAFSFFAFQQNDVRAATGFAKPNLAGTWYIYITVTETAQDATTPTNYFVQRAGYVRGVINVNKNGVVTPATDSLYYYDFKAGASIIDVTGGTLSLSKEGVVNGTINIIDSSATTDTITIEHSKMDRGKTIITGIVRDASSSATYGMISAVKQ